MTFRWYGEQDLIPLSYIRHVPYIKGIVSAVYDVAPGEVWPTDRISALKHLIEQAGLQFEVVESVPVHEAIKLGLPARDSYIANYKETLRRLGKAGIKVVCYNFMPAFDWFRTVIDKPLPDGSFALAFSGEELKKIEPGIADFTLPGWDLSYPKEELPALMSQYKELGKEGLWENLNYFLAEIIPAAENVGIKMAIHPDDPPWPIFGLPRILSKEADFDRLLELQPSHSNGVTFCSGSLGSSPDNNLPKMLDKYASQKRVHFVHLRNVKRYPNGDFEESAHLSESGSIDMAELVQILHQHTFEGYVRPDHGRMIWGEQGKPGYGLYDRALGAAYLTGLWEALQQKGGTIHG